MIHMENKDLLVAIVFSPICGPKCPGLNARYILSVVLLGDISPIGQELVHSVAVIGQGGEHQGGHTGGVHKVLGDFQE